MRWSGGGVGIRIKVSNVKTAPVTDLDNSVVFLRPVHSTSPAVWLLRLNWGPRCPPLWTPRGRPSGSTGGGASESLPPPGIPAELCLSAGLIDPVSMLPWNRLASLPCGHCSHVTGDEACAYGYLAATWWSMKGHVAT